MSSGQGKFPLEVVTDNNLLRQRYEDAELGGANPLMVTTSAQGVGFPINVDVPRVRGPRFGVIGDSISQNGTTYSPGTGTLYWTQWGYVCHLRRALGSRIDLPMSRVYAVGGSKIDHAVNTQLPKALADNLDFCIVHDGTNNVGNTSAEDVIAGLKTIYDALRANGTHVIAIPIRFRGPLNPLSGVNSVMVSAVNRWIAEYAAANKNITCHDINPLYVDYATGAVKSGPLMNDGVHDAVPGALMMGADIATLLDPILPRPLDDEFLHVADVYDAATNPFGNLVLNGLLSGAGGTASGTGTTGTIPDSWLAWRSSAGSTVTMALSKEALRTGLDRTVITIGGTGNGGNHSFLQNVSSGKVVEGDIVGAWINNVEFNFPDGNIAGLGMSISFLNASNTVLAKSFDGYYSEANGKLPVEAQGAIRLEPEPMIAPAGTDKVEVKIFFVPGSTGAVSGTIKIGPISCRKLRSAI